MDIEELLIQWFTSLGYRAFADVPDPRLDEFLTIERTGGPRTNVAIDNPSVAVQCWSTSKANASVLANKVERHLLDLVFHSNVSRVNINGKSNFRDLESGQARYQIIAGIVHLN